ncbi:hypothetical protein V3C99_008528, partial [Haemonchus contortus]
MKVTYMVRTSSYLIIFRFHSLQNSVLQKGFQHTEKTNGSLMYLFAGIVSLFASSTE